MANNKELLFRKGLLENLSDAKYIEGALSFTTDEPAIYLDVNNKHVRLGDIKQFANAKEFSDYLTEHTGHIPTTALYYVVGTSPESTNANDKIGSTVFYNALLKWTGSSWIQINEKSDFTGDIEAVSSIANSALSKANTAQGEIDALEQVHVTDKATLQGNIDKVAGDLSKHLTAYSAKVKTLEEADVKHTDDIASATNAIGAEKTRAENAEKALGERIDDVKDDITNLGKDKQDKKIGTAARIVVTDASGNIAVSTIGSDKLAYLSDVTGNIGTSLSGLSGSIDTINNNLGSGTVDSRIATAKDGAIAAAKTETEKQVGAEAEARAAAVKGVADDLSAHKTAYAAKIGALEEADTSIGNTINSLTDRVDDLETADTTIRGEFAAADNKLREDFAKADTQILNNAKSHAESQANAVRGETTETVASVDAKVATLSGSVNTLSGKIGDSKSGLTKEVADLKAADTTIRGEIATAKSGAVSSAKSYTDTEIAKVKNGSTETLDSLDTKISNNYNTLNQAIASEASARGTAISNLETAYKAADAALKAELEAVINDTMAEAADAMKFMGVVNSKTELPTTGVKAGWTYKVGTNFDFNGGKVYVGDLLIAGIDQKDDNPYAVGNWAHVASGYEDDHDVHLEMNGNTAKIVNAAGQNRGSIVFETVPSSNLVVAVSQVAKDSQSKVTDMKVSLTFEWGSF